MYFLPTESELLKIEKLMNRAFDVGDTLIGYSLFCIIRAVISKPYAERFVPLLKEVVNEDSLKSPFRNVGAASWREEYIRQLNYLAVTLSENQPTTGELLRTLAFGLNSCLEEKIVRLCLNIDEQHPHPFEGEQQRIRHQDMMNSARRRLNGTSEVRNNF